MVLVWNVSFYEVKMQCVSQYDLHMFIWGGRSDDLLAGGSLDVCLTHWCEWRIAAVTERDAVSMKDTFWDMKSLKPHVIVSAFQSGSDFLNLVWEDQLQNLESFASGVTVDLLFSAVYQLQHHQD